MTDTALLSLIRTRPVTVIGLGISNLPLIDFLLSVGAKITARDKKSLSELDPRAAALPEKGVRLILGEGYLDDINESIIFRSPGLRPDLPELAQALQNGAILTSEMELFLELTPATVLGVTGSDGKSTTTTLTALMLEAECKKRGVGRVFVGGNLGTPLLPRVKEMTEADFAVVELSSFQLQTLRRSPARAALTNITPNHLNWHTDMAEYISAKTNIFSHAPNTALITNAENEISFSLSRDYPGDLTLFSSVKQSHADFSLEKGNSAIYRRDGMILFWDGKHETPVLPTKEILLPGRHNVENYMTAYGLCRPFVSCETVKEIAKSFTGVPHRLERIRIHEGVTYYNSSIDSSPTRTAAALSALREKPIVICGGRDKGIPFEPLAKALAERAKAVILTGEAAPKIKAVLRDTEAVQSGALPVWEESDFKEAVLLSRKLAKAGDTVLLSPACTSFDAFKNFEERGDAFRRIVLSF
ncbi:MAG: UDP-N-acetylmuramoyl-L-alanine--D-glutamate ligase [Clostridia bacterium]|nr:UDP-N-acetylmuramoyl-L-alanine--D-glutamate ligase [Clostridia bacterium]